MHIDVCMYIILKSQLYILLIGQIEVTYIYVCIHIILKSQIYNCFIWYIKVTYIHMYVHAHRCMYVHNSQESALYLQIEVWTDFPVLQSCYSEFRRELSFEKNHLAPLGKDSDFLSNGVKYFLWYFIIQFVYLEVIHLDDRVCVHLKSACSHRWEFVIYWSCSTLAFRRKEWKRLSTFFFPWKENFFGEP